MITPPLIPEPIRKRTKNNGVSSAGGNSDTLRYINVSGWIEEYIRSHNEKHADQPEMCLKAFSDDANARHRNIRAKRRVEVFIMRMIPELYGKNTFNEARKDEWQKMDDVIKEVAADHALAVFSQGENDWIVRKLIEENMETKSRKYRKSKSKACQSIARSSEPRAMDLPNASDNASAVPQPNRNSANDTGPDPSPMPVDINADIPAVPSVFEALTCTEGSSSAFVLSGALAAASATINEPAATGEDMTRTSPEIRIETFSSSSQEEEELQALRVKVKLLEAKERARVSASDTRPGIAKRNRSGGARRISQLIGNGNAENNGSHSGQIRVSGNTDNRALLRSRTRR